MSLDISRFAMTAAQQAIATKHRLPAERRAALAREHGEAYAAEYEDGYNASVAEGVVKGAREERERCRAILESPEAQGRREAAVIMATETDMPADVARRMLAGLAKATGLAARMMGLTPLNLDPEDPDPAAASRAGNFGWDDVATDMNREAGVRRPGPDAR